MSVTLKDIAKEVKALKHLRKVRIALYADRMVINIAELEPEHSLLASGQLSASIRAGLEGSLSKATSFTVEAA